MKENIEEKIPARAYELYLERGGEDGHDVEDWLAAEGELRPEPEIVAAEVELVAHVREPEMQPRFDHAAAGRSK
jgi:hypothetical protein